MSRVMRLFSRWKRSETTYSELKTSEEAADGQNGDPVPQKCGPAYREPSLWALSVFFASLSLYQYYQSVKLGPMGTYETGWWSDFEPARAHIEIEAVQFRGAPSVDDNGSLFIPNPDPIQYVGDPSPAVDEAWDKLTWGRYILITEEEAKKAWGRFGDVSQFWDHQRGGYVAGLDMFHTLHCVHQIRMLLHPEYYPVKQDKKAGLHRDHCLEQIRQYIMCAGDMTPIPTKYYKSIDRNYVDSDYPHTCRNFEKLQEWMVDRYDGKSAVKPDFDRGEKIEELGD